MGAYTPYLAAYFKQQGADPYELPHLTDDILSLGRAETSAKEYLPFPALLGSILAERKNDQTPAQFLICLLYTSGVRLCKSVMNRAP